MSEQTIREKSQVIRNETNKYANTRERVAGVLDDINETKANKDASGLSEANKRNWRQELDIYDKKSINENKLDKPTITDDGHNYPYVVLVDEFGDSAKAPVGDLGKNMANSRLTTTTEGSITQGANYTWNTAGYHFYLTGLANKSADPTFNLLLAQNSNGQTAVSNGKAVLENLMSVLPNVEKDIQGNYDNGFNLYPIYNPQTKQLKITDKPQVVTNFNVPNTININHNTNIANVEYKVPTDYPQDVKDLLNFVKRVDTLGFTKVRKNEFVVRMISQNLIPAGLSGYSFPQDLFSFPQDGLVIFNSYNKAWREWSRYWLDYQQVDRMNTAGQTAIFNLFINKEFPSDKDWVIKMRKLHNGWYLADERNGLSFTNRVEDLPTWTDVALFFTHDNYMANYNTRYQNIYIIKKGNVLALLTQDTMENGAIKMNLLPYNSGMKYLKIQDRGLETRNDICTHEKWSYGDISYWIEP